MSTTDKYGLRGVSSTKEEVYRAIRHLDKGLEANAFCKILPDIVGQSSAHANLMHADTAGTKTVLAYLYWKETGDVRYFRSIAQDAIVMNTDDLACTGIVDSIILSSTIARNAHRIPGIVLEAIMEGTNDFIHKMHQYDIDLHLAGGETADVGDVVRTIDVGITAFARAPRQSLIINRITAGAVIVGLASDGQATYEYQYNSGIGSNGLTSARHDLLHCSYAEKYPESYAPEIPTDQVYVGPYQLTDTVDIDGRSYEIAELLLAPTRTYLPVLRKIYHSYRDRIQGVIHCTGGGQTKVLKYVQGVHIVKDRLFDPPLVFRLIQKHGKTSWEEMYRVFNMGHRMELYTDEETAEDIVREAGQFGIQAKIIGKVLPLEDESAQALLTIKTPHCTCQYRK